MSENMVLSTFLVQDCSQMQDHQQSVALSNVDISGWAPNAAKEINSPWSNKVSGFLLSWVFIIFMKEGSEGPEVEAVS